jgi:ADP-ribosyl-[dinitrogen reductase] hydrolase
MSKQAPYQWESSLQGCLLGSAVGDALGLACEGLSPRRQKSLFPDLSHYHFLPGKRGMISDDTEHLCLVAQALLRSGGEPKAFQRALAWQLRFWLLGLPAGIGLATLKGILKLWLGVSPEHSGVFSAGNGPAMRASLLGVLYATQPEKLKTLNRISTRLTHSDPKAEWGALAIALAAGFQTLQHPQAEFVSQFRRLLPTPLPPEAQELLTQLEQAALRAEQTREQGLLSEQAQQAALQSLLESLGCKKGVTGYMYHTVPAVIFVWLLQPDSILKGLQLLIRAGGDTDTTAALLGAILGAERGSAALPPDLLKTLWEWPRSTTWMSEAGKKLLPLGESEAPQPRLELAVWQLPLRNFIFFFAVLFHGFRRLFPPY